MSSEILYKALKASQKGQNYAFATITEATLKGTPRKMGAKMIVLDDGSARLEVLVAGAMKKQPLPNALRLSKVKSR